jgi:uncharacterized protein (TIGR02246 family)
MEEVLMVRSQHIGAILTALALCVIAASIISSAQRGPMATPPDRPSATIEQEVRLVIQQVDSAFKSHNRDGIDSLMAEDFVILHSTGKLESRQSFLDRAAAGSLVSQRVPAEVVEDTIRLYGGSTALRTTRIKAVLRLAGGTPVEMSFRTIDVYVKLDGRWLWVSEQSTPIPTEPSPGQKT